MQESKAIVDALRFAAERHRTQRRKDREQSPYINHPIQVAGVLLDAGVRDCAAIQAALLHDVLEDTDATPREIRHLFGERVLDLVLEVTDDKALPWAERKAAQIRHAPELSCGAAMIKVADKTCNLYDLAYRPPVGWDESRCRRYIDWSCRVVEALKPRLSGNALVGATLVREFCLAHTAATATLGD